MKPVVFWIGHTPITAYGILLSLSITLAWMYCDWFFKKMKYDMMKLQIGFIIVIICGILGTRVFYIFTVWDEFLANPRMFLQLRSAGMVAYGALIFGVIATIIYFKLAKITLGDVADMAAVPTLLSVAITRIGCFMNGCCYGKETNFFLGVQYPPRSFPNRFLHPGDLIPHRHPVQLYESLVCFLLAFLAWKMLNKRKARAATFFTMNLIYGIARFFLEFLRGDDIRGIYGLFSTSQYISMFIVPVSIFMLAWVNKNQKLPENQYGLTPPPMKTTTKPKKNKHE